MSLYTVLWRQTATDQLAEIWMSSSQRTELAQVVEAIDTVLSTSPLGDLSQELAEGLRTITVLPLRVIYAVQEQDRIVDVATVRCVV